MKSALFIARKEVQYMLKAKETLLWVFIMPPIFFFFIGTITSGFGPRAERQDRLAVRQGADAGFLVDQLIHRLEERDYEIVEPETDEIFTTYNRRLSIPAAFTDSVLAGTPTTVALAYKEGGLTNDYDKVRVMRAVYTVLADMIVSGEMDHAPTPEGFARLNEMPRTLSIDVSAAGERTRPPTGYEQAIPGIMVMFTLLIMVTSGAIMLVIARRQGLLRRLASTPISRFNVVVGKWGGKLALAIVQIAFAMVIALLPPFNMVWGADWGMILVVMLAYAMMMAAIGLLLGTFARTDGQAAAIGVIASNVLAALGGCWWPVEILPPWMQTLQLFTPTGWAMDALHKLISFGAGPLSAIPHVVGMSIGAVILLAVSAKTFRFE